MTTQPMILDCAQHQLCRTAPILSVVDISANFLCKLKISVLNLLWLPQSCSQQYLSLPIQFCVILNGIYQHDGFGFLRICRHLVALSLLPIGQVNIYF